MKTNKTFAYGFLTVIIVLGILFPVACKEEPPTPEPLDATVSFVPLAASFPSPTIDFSPSATLPTGVTYILTDNRTPQNSWNSANGFDGRVTAADYYVSLNDDVTFTQTFYFNSVEITGANSKRTVVATAGTSVTTRFVASSSDSGSVTLKWP